MKNTFYFFATHAHRTASRRSEIFFRSISSKAQWISRLLAQFDSKMHLLSTLLFSPFPSSSLCANSQDTHIQAGSRREINLLAPGPGKLFLPLPLTSLSPLSTGDKIPLSLSFLLHFRKRPYFLVKEKGGDIYHTGEKKGQGDIAPSSLNNAGIFFV